MLPMQGQRSEESPTDKAISYVMQPVGYFQYNANSTSPNDLPVSAPCFSADGEIPDC